MAGRAEKPITKLQSTGMKETTLSSKARYATLAKRCLKPGLLLSTRELLGTSRSLRSEFQHCLQENH
ncbi:MAG: hypothetical protein ACK5T6_05085, partial [Pirellula sp.]